MTTVHSPEDVALLSNNDSSFSILTVTSGKKTLPPLVPALILSRIAFHLLNTENSTPRFLTAFTVVSLKIISVKFSRLNTKFIQTTHTCKVIYFLLLCFCSVLLFYIIQSHHMHRLFSLPCTWTYFLFLFSKSYQLSKMFTQISPSHSS